MSYSRNLLFCAVLFIFFTTGCTNTKPVLQTPPNFVPAKHLVFIGLDGCGGAYVSKANMPTLKRMISQGAWTLKAKSILPSNSWPNWSSLFCGTPLKLRSVDAKKEASINKAVKMIDYFPSIFTVVNSSDRAKRPVFFYEWEEHKNMCPDEAADKQRIVSNLESARKIAAYIIEKKPTFTAMVFDEPDTTGHAAGWGSAAYYAILTEMDSLIAVIEQAVKDAGIYDSTVFIISADHGGVLHGHGTFVPKHRTIPLVIYGRGIKKGFVMTFPVGICDIAPTMATILGMEIPSEWTGRFLQEIFDKGQQ